MTRQPEWWQRRSGKLAILGVVVGMLVGVAWLGTRNKSSPRPDLDHTVLLPQPMAVAPGVYLLGRSSPAAVYAVETSQGLVLIDSGEQASAATVIAQLKELRLDIRKLRAILLTHAHADHSMGAAHLRSLTGAKIYAGRADCQPLREGRPREAFVSTFHMPHVVPHPTPVDEELEGNETLEFGDTRFVVLGSPGHTPGSVCYLLERPDLRALFAGDVIVSLSQTSAPLGPLGTYAAHLAPVYRGSARDYLASLRRLRAMPVPDLVLPGHPRMDQVPHSPHLTEEAWQHMLGMGIREMETLLARYETDGANFLDGSPKELLPGLHYLGDCAGSAVYCLATAKALFLFDAPGGAPLVDFLAARFKKLGWQERKLTAVLLTSADEEATAGLPALVRRTGCQVVAPKAGLETIRRLCPADTRIITDEDLEKRDWFEVQSLSLGGRGLAPLAYQVRWVGKTVLISGRIPVKRSHPSFEQLVREVTGPGGSVEDYLRSLAQLARMKPDLWLPAVPVQGQNANLYDQDWERVLAQNAQLFP